jgi:sugar-specific transcriptional regulator TrmB
MVKYKEYVQKMLDENKETFTEFRKLHDEYAKDQKGLQKKYNEEGSKIQDIIRDYEDRLCRNTERGVYNKFSGGLSEKFQNEIRKIFPMIDHIGLIISESPPPKPQFSIPKITLK